MTTTALFIATRKGAWFLHGDAARRSWRLDGPHFLGHTHRFHDGVVTKKALNGNSYENEYDEGSPFEQTQYAQKTNRGIEEGREGGPDARRHLRLADALWLLQGIGTRC